jgi:hypothetical protein
VRFPVGSLRAPRWCLWQTIPAAPISCPPTIWPPLHAVEDPASKSGNQSGSGRSYQWSSSFSHQLSANPQRESTGRPPPPWRMSRPPPAARSDRRRSVRRRAAEAASRGHSLGCPFSVAAAPPVSVAAPLVTQSSRSRIRASRPGTRGRDRRSAISRPLACSTRIAPHAASAC